MIRNTKQIAPVPSRRFSSSSLEQTYYPAVRDFSRGKKGVLPTQKIRLMNPVAVKASFH